MYSKELRGLIEAYSEVYAPQEVDEEMKPLPKEKMERQAMRAYKKERIAIDRRDDPEANRQMQRRIAMQSPASRRNVLQNKKMSEELDIFDIVLEFLQVEGFAETLEEAEWMMANVIDEEAIEIILGEEQLDEISLKTKMKAYAATQDPEADYAYGSKVHAQGDRLRNAIVKKHGEKAGENADAHADASHWGRKDASGKKKGFAQSRTDTPNKYRTRADGKMHGQDQNKLKAKLKRRIGEEYVDEAQVANRDPEKYEREQSKKSAPVRGERTPMPPRGDKRREDFEKWYAANVR